MEDAVITKHAEKRIRERVGIPKGATDKNAERALKNGLTQADLNGSLSRYVAALYFKYKTATNIRVYCRNVYLFNWNTLITVVPLPQKYRKHADALEREKRSKRGE